MTQIQTSPYAFAELQGLVIDWAKERNINSIESQYLKIIEEVGELAKAINSKNYTEIIDAFGDVAVTLVVANKIVEKKKIALPTQRTKKATNLYIKGILFGISIADFHEAYAELYSLAKHLGYDLNDCLWAAYNVIKDRKGKTVDGNFIKEVAPQQEQKYNYIQPPHYKNKSSIDVIDVCQMFKLDFTLGTIIKYLARLGEKPNEPITQDCQKILEYINRDLEAKNKEINYQSEVEHQLTDNPFVAKAIREVLKANLFSLRRGKHLNEVKTIVNELINEANNSGN
jgi:NTP pyrophosphatase (non-canonical NTP hydrolase)